MKLTEGFNLLATAPDGIKRLRELILSLAVQGKLVPQDPNDKPASELLKQIRAEKQRLVAEGKIKKDKELSVIAPDEQPFKIPATYELIRLGTVLSMVNGRAFRSADWICEGIPIIRIQNLNNIDAPFNYCAREGLDERHLVRNGNLLISWSGTPGTSFGAFIWNRGEAALNQHIFRCEQIGSAYAPEFLKLAINSQLNVLISQAQGGVGLQHVTKGTLESLVLPLPPLAEQSRIVAKVEELMALCDALEARGQLEAEQHARLTATLFDALAASESAQQLQENWARLAASFDLVLDRPQAVDALEQTILQLAVRGLLVPQDPADEPASELLKCRIPFPSRFGTLLNQRGSS
ncbi:MAG: restriction endonuclease subunit S [Vogesella sp.]|uniref:restriction endonuclease subunit S n=1 Tax=Vogesella sp. TaxID=1904252 RepID=UPI00391A75F8